jgi:hypothetical protein
MRQARAHNKGEGRGLLSLLGAQTSLSNLFRRRTDSQRSHETQLNQDMSRYDT